MIIGKNLNLIRRYVVNEFLFVIFKENSQGEFVLDGIKFWGFPDRLVDEVKRVWQETRKILAEGIELTKKGNRISTNFPQSRINNIVFTKIHASNSLYELEPGSLLEKGKNQILISYLMVEE